MFTTTVADVLTQIYCGLTQRGITLMVSQAQLIGFINYAISEIYSFEGRNWSFAYEVDVDVTPPVGTANEAVFTHDFTEPISKIVAVIRADNTDRVFDLARTPAMITDMYKYYFRRFGTTIMLKNQNGASYKVTYVRSAPLVSDPTDVIQVPSIFIPPLYDLALSYVVPLYGQYGDGKELNLYTRGQNKLATLAKSDVVPAGILVPNIK